MRHFKTVFPATLVLLICVVAGSAQDKTSGAVKGKVSVERGSPLGVAVLLLQGDDEIMRTSTDKKGEFVIAHVTPGVYTARFRKPGLSIASIDKLEVRAGQTRSLKDIRLSIDEGSIAFLRGSVFTESGRSIPGVRVELVRMIDESSTEKIDSRITGETGEFVFRVPPETAKYRLTVKADGAQPASKDVEVDGAAVYRIALVLKPVPR